VISRPWGGREGGVRGVLGGPGAVGGTGDSPAGRWGAVGFSPAGQKAVLGCQGMPGGSAAGWGAASGCRGTSGGCPVGRGSASAPRAAAQPCGRAALGGCSPRCSRRCPRCAGTAGDSGGLRGALAAPSLPPHAHQPLLTQHLRSAGSGRPSRPLGSPGGTRCGAEQSFGGRESGRPAPPDTVPVTVALGQRSRPGHPPPAASLPAGRRAG